MIYTAVAQLTSFCLLSLQSDAIQGAFLEAELRSVKVALKVWAEPYEDAANFLEEGTESSDEGDKTCDSAPTRQYCSQACLLGLKKGWDLDNGCPNVLSHRTAGGDGIRHCITADQFTRLVSERLRENPYRDCLALDGWGKIGAIGVLFKLEVPSYGYTFVGKGTLSDRLKRLQNECDIYARLDTLQGWVVPVHLGLVHLDRGYILPGAVCVVHMMLMSWVDACMGELDLKLQRQRSLQAVWAAGVDQGDERDANLLWNVERGRVMVIDFDRVALIPAPKHRQVSKLSKMKRRHGADCSEGSRKRGPLYNGLQSS
ncbi:hypothetical protein BCR38DRAFT_390672 [Pseudomassariella vexata]|uniref:Aminoglycoside phosphotransferase domain-containing protein n=1 Tax=Pseudomassariella vexata TaxID=1141098 RepID=A0A1Y2DZZ1_9PEZI|nr:hypothetical protein BCR38DRAFT_390672 [Pseudomassariella vexata]